MATEPPAITTDDLTKSFPTRPDPSRPSRG